jgi:cobalt/nickel transport system permease protein
MHIPDGFIDGSTSAGAAAVAAGGLGVALRRAGDELDERQVPLAGLVAAFVFAAQMLNFPVASGTSGHLIGGALATILVGPAVGVVCVTVVLLVQALLFADGGLSALGLNVVNMALVTSLVTWLVVVGVRRVVPWRPTSVVVAGGVAAGLSVVASAGAFTLEYAVGGTGGASIAAVATAMLGVHAAIAVGEGVITGLVVSSVLATRPDLVWAARPLALSPSPTAPAAAEPAEAAS